MHEPKMTEASTIPRSPFPIPGGTLADWLDYQQRIHPRDIALGLDRVGAVWRRLGAPAPAPVVITVGGTNGKGSTVALLEAMLTAAGARVGAYTSPHLLRYNERVRIAGAEAGDEALVAAFERIEAARGDVPLTWFEYGTLAALWLFAASPLDVALLEVGLGGRLDAVNLIDADVAIVTTVALDHQDWLGNDRDAIGREKAGIFRPGRVAVVGEADPPAGLLATARRSGALLRRAGRDFTAVAAGDGWRWRGWPTADTGGGVIPAPELLLPMPALAASCQVDNAAAAIAALHALRTRLPWDPAAIARGLQEVEVAARLQRFGNGPELVVDVGHNPQAAAELARWLAREPARGRTFAVFGALGDKDVAGVVEALAPRIDAWHLVALDRASPRGLDGDALRARLPAAAGGRIAGSHAGVAAALAAALSACAPDDRVLAFGSFFVAAPALAFASGQGLQERRRNGADATSTTACTPDPA